MTQTHVFYSGTVQGIGFRYTVERYASELDLKGWVRNLRDGRVELLVEGSHESIAQFLQKIDQHFAGYIKDKDMRDTKAEGSFEEFRIAF